MQPPGPPPPGPLPYDGSPPSPYDGLPSSCGTRRPSRLGARLPRRPEPRFGVTLAGVGVGLVVFGIVVLGAARTESLSDTGHRAVGIVLSLAAVVAGYAVLAVRRDGPASTAGVALSALGVPVLLGFLFSTAHASPTVTVNVGVPLSIVVWLVSYLRVPGAAGHVFYLGAAVLEFWFWIMYLIGKDSVTALAASSFGAFEPDVDRQGVFYSSGGSTFTTIAVVSILLGLLYYLSGVLLDRTGRRGPAVAFVAGGFVAMVAGLAAAAVNAPTALEGVLILIAGAGLSLLGARSRRRFTTWVWGVAVAVGIVTILADVVTSDTTAGILLIVLGALVVAIGILAATVLREPDETVPTRPA